MNGSLRCLILAPTGEDAALIAEVLAADGLLPHPCTGLQGLCAEIARGAGAVVVAAEAVAGHAAAEIAAALAEDPVWSVLPFVLLTSADDAAALGATMAGLFGPHASVAITERPCRSATLASAVRLALYARQRQYEVHSLLQRLDRQTKDLERSNGDLHRFASAASHDLQAPLRSMMNYLTLLEKRNAHSLDERSRGYVRHVLDGAERMHGLIRALLEYGKVGEVKPRMSLFPSHAAVTEAIHNLEAMIEESRTTITIGALPTIFADRALIVVLFQNLIGNAIKYRSADPHVEIAATVGDGEWTFMVTDNGIGIAPQDQERIFEAFQRVHAPHEYAGHGIGLATCKRIADIHRGRIWVESDVGVGSRFFVSIRRFQ